jgi:hypothetical protein
MSAAVSALRRQLEELVPTPRGGSRGVATGIADLDALLPMGGLPKGKLTEIRGQRSIGVTTVLRQIIATVSQNGLVAYVDAGRTLGAGDFVGNGESGIGNRNSGKREARPGSAPPRRASGVGPSRSPIPSSRFPIPDNLWFIRPPRPNDAPWCVDVLLRSGAFALVVLDGGPPLSRSIGARLIRLARETGTALVVAGEGEAGRGSGVVGAAVRVVVGNRESGNGNRGFSAVTSPDVATPQNITSPGVAETFPVSRFPFPSPTRLLITIEKGGIRRGIEVEYAIGLEDRLCAHPEVGDRRGAQSGIGNRESGIGLGVGDSGVGFTGIGAESEFGSGRGSGSGKRGAGNGKRETENGEPTPASAAGGHKRRKAKGGVPAPDSDPARFPIPDSRFPTLGSTSNRPRLRPRPRQAGVAGGDAGGDPRGDDGDGGPRVMRGARGAAVG